MRESWGGPFNGQKRRQELFAAIVRETGSRAIVETGTFRGTTTAHMRQVTGAEVWTVEADREAFGFCVARFLTDPGVHVRCADSREFLARTAARWLAHETPFVYLDAHWFEDLPLAEELITAFSLWPRATVMVDDFCVPFDAGYGFDDYGPGKRLDVEYLKPLPLQPLRVFFPAVPSTEETGARRGCAVLAQDPEVAGTLASFNTLREWSDSI
ncbi:MAG: hypothetical protein BWX64_01800 [Acidobacteria bacterium ADurb.Bin051]|nr:MAG: hypothetical protein BWX64_01800 [Acidobacteria bacterium ADurb.Bin051]